MLLAFVFIHQWNGDTHAHIFIILSLILYLLIKWIINWPIKSTLIAWNGVNFPNEFFALAKKKNICETLNSAQSRLIQNGQNTFSIRSLSYQRLLIFSFNKLNERCNFQLMDMDTITMCSSIFQIWKKKAKYLFNVLTFFDAARCWLPINKIVNKCCTVDGHGHILKKSINGFRFKTSTAAICVEIEHSRLYSSFVAGFFYLFTFIVIVYDISR